MVISIQEALEGLLSSLLAQVNAFKSIAPELGTPNS